MAAITALTSAVFFTYSLTIFLAIEKCKKTGADVATIHMGIITFRYNVLYGFCMLIFSILHILTDLIRPIGWALLGFAVIVTLITLVYVKSLWTWGKVKKILL